MGGSSLGIRPSQSYCFPKVNLKNELGGNVLFQELTLFKNGELELLFVEPHSVRCKNEVYTFKDIKYLLRQL